MVLSKIKTKSKRTTKSLTKKNTVRSDCTPPYKGMPEKVIDPISGNLISTSTETGKTIWYFLNCYCNKCPKEKILDFRTGKCIPKTNRFARTNKKLLSYISICDTYAKANKLTKDKSFIERIFDYKFKVNGKEVRVKDIIKRPSKRFSQLSHLQKALRIGGGVLGLITFGALVYLIIIANLNETDRTDYIKKMATYFRNGDKFESIFKVVISIFSISNIISLIVSGGSNFALWIPQIGSAIWILFGGKGNPVDIKQDGTIIIKELQPIQNKIVPVEVGKNILMSIKEKLTKQELLQQKGGIYYLVESSVATDPKNLDKIGVSIKNKKVEMEGIQAYYNAELDTPIYEIRNGESVSTKPNRLQFHIFMKRRNSTELKDIKKELQSKLDFTENKYNNFISSYAPSSDIIQKEKEKSVLEQKNKDLQDHINHYAENLSKMPETPDVQKRKNSLEKRMVTDTMNITVNKIKISKIDEQIHIITEKYINKSNTPFNLTPVVTQLVFETLKDDLKNITDIVNNKMDLSTYRIDDQVINFKLKAINSNIDAIIDSTNRFPDAEKERVKRQQDKFKEQGSSRGSSNYLFGNSRIKEM